MAFSDTWTESDPTGSTYANTLATILTQAVKRALRERLAIDHYFYASEGSYTDVGYHKQVTLPVLAANPTGAANKVCIYSEDSTSKAALKVKTEDNAEIQLTERDWGLLDDFALGNNTPLRARNAADDGFVNILKVNSTGQINFPAQILLDDGFNCNKKQAVNMVIENRTDDTDMTTTGMIWFRTDV